MPSSLLADSLLAPLPTIAAPAATPLADLVGGGVVVPVVSGRRVRYANMDYAASAPALRVVADLVGQALPLYASVHRGAGYASQACTAAYEAARRDVAAFVGAGDDDVTIFTRNTTDALNLLAAAVPGRVVHLDIEHHANLLPWLAIESSTVLAGQTFAQTFQALDRELARAPAALLAVTGASNVTGECPPIGELAELAHRHGARIVVDGAQLAPHRRVQVEATGIDYLAISGHKLYAPYGGGALIGRRDWLDATAPHLAGGGAVVNVTNEGAEWKQSPARHEGGTPNLVGAVALAAGLEALDALGHDRVAAHETALYERLEQGLRSLGISILRIWPEHRDLVAVASFTVPGYRADLVAAYLSAEHGIGVRGGRFCAHPLLDRLGLADDGAVRVSIGLGTSGEDVEALLNALERLLSRGPTWAYAPDEAGGLAPNPDPRPSMIDAVLAGRFAVVD